MIRRGSNLGVYVHVPYCSSRCGYCDFNTYVPGESGRGNPSEWADAAVREIKLRAGESSSQGTVRRASTVFFGGGTPTLLPPQDLGRVVRALADEIGVADDAEVTVEANPETVTPQVADGLLQAGINRISIGMQSADPLVLRVLERKHTSGGSLRAVDVARGAGFQRISLDLIYGTPGESLGSWSETVDAALSADTDHVSAYALKVEEGTSMARRVTRDEISAPDDDACAAAYEVADTRFSTSGLPWYEISNWAHPGSECRHNMGYWRGDDWWGIGPGAHGHQGGRRYWNVRHPLKWQARVKSGELAEQGSEMLSPSEQLMETVMMGVRLREGLVLSTVGLDPMHPELRALESEGLIARQELPYRIVLSRHGRLLGDRVTLRVLEALERP